MKAYGYMRTSSATNIDGDSETRQRLAIESYAASQGIQIVDWFYDAAVKGSDSIESRAGFSAMLGAIAESGVRVVICESPDRFARDLIVGLTGFDMLKRNGVQLIPTTAPDHYTEDSPTATLIRTVLAAVAQFDKCQTVAKLQAARARAKVASGRTFAKPSVKDTEPELTAMVQALKADGMSLRAISDRLVATGQRKLALATIAKLAA